MDIIGLELDCYERLVASVDAVGVFDYIAVPREKSDIFRLLVANLRRSAGVEIGDR